MEGKSERVQLTMCAPAVALVALLSYAWVVPLNFQIDDFFLIPNADGLLKNLGGMLIDVKHMTGGGSPLLDLSEHPNFQPTLWTVLALVKPAAGTPANPAAFHGAILLLHAAASLLVLRVLGRLLPAPSALLGATLFALLPAGAQGVSWISAGSHVLTALFALLAMDALLRDGTRPRGLWFAGMCLALSFWSHTQALAWIALALGTALWRPPRGVSRAACLVALLVPVALAWWVRARYMGSWSLGYRGLLSPGMTTIPRMIEAVPVMAGQIALPWNRQEAVAELRPLAALLAPRFVWFVPFLLSLAIPFLAARPRPLRPAALAALATGILLGPALLAWSLYLDDPDNRGSRSLYSPAPGIALLMALAARHAGAIPSLWLRRTSVVSIALVFALSVDALVHVARTELHAAEQIGRRLSSLSGAAASAGDGTTLIAVDGAGTLAGIPLIGHEYLPAAMGPPFQPARIDVIALPWMRDLAEARHLARIAGPVLVLEWDGGAFAVRSFTGAMPARMPGLLPATVPPEMGLPDARRFVPDAATPARRIGRVRVELAPGESGPVSLLARSHEVNRLLAIETAPEDSHIQILLDEDLEWLFSPAFVDVLVAGERAVRVAGNPISLLPDGDDSLEVLAPSPGTSLPAEGPFRFRVGELPPRGDLVLAFEFRLEGSAYAMEYRIPLDPPPLGADGSLVPAREHLVVSTFPAPSPVALDDLAEIFRTTLHPYNVRELSARFRFTVLHPATGRSLPRVRSPWVPVLIQSRS